MKELLRAIMTSGQGGGRTLDTRIFSPVLYQLSYLTARRTELSFATNQLS